MLERAVKWVPLIWMFFLYFICFLSILYRSVALIFALWISKKYPTELSIATKKYWTYWNLIWTKQYICFILCIIFLSLTNGTFSDCWRRVNNPDCPGCVMTLYSVGINLLLYCGCKSSNSSLKFYKTALTNCPQCCLD